MKIQLTTLFIILVTPLSLSFSKGENAIYPAPDWGFWAHKLINRAAVYRLPAEMATFFKKNIEFISENAVNPDRRRYAVLGEAERHYIDLDAYGEDFRELPRAWVEAKARFGEDSLRKHGIAPWYLQDHLQRLTEAFRLKNYELILRLATDLGHYIADIHVPLHTTKNYNGQLTGQDGIHAFWESRLPELYAREYSLWLGPASYIDHPADIIWETVFNAHAACDSVLKFEKIAAERVPESNRYAYEVRNQVLVKIQSRAFSETYHRLLNGQVERQLKSSVKLIGDLWYTCWVNAGQPRLTGSVELPEGSMPSLISTDTLLNVRIEP